MKTLETMNAKERKAAPVYSGVLKYFPDALVEVAILSKIGNDQHNPGEPLHWAKEKSTDEGDALVRHQLQAGTFDTDGIRHSAKVAWRALAQLQRELEAAVKAEADPLLEIVNEEGGQVWRSKPMPDVGYARAHEKLIFNGNPNKEAEDLADIPFPAPSQILPEQFVEGGVEPDTRAMFRQDPVDNSAGGEPARTSRVKNGNLK